VEGLPHVEAHPVAHWSTREGISSNNPFHQFLTLWKVYENTCRVRGAWRKEHRLKDKRVREEVVPDAFGYAGYVDLAFDEVKKRLNDPFRVAIAHGDGKGDGKPRTAASAEDLMAVSYAVPVVRYMAQTTLENVRATLASTKQGGVVNRRNERSRFIAPAAGVLPAQSFERRDMRACRLQKE
jgi:hypothetical protein